MPAPSQRTVPSSSGGAARASEKRRTTRRWARRTASRSSQNRISPPWIIATRSAMRSISVRRWEEKRTLRPSSATARMTTRRMSRRTIGSRPEESSSRASRSGWKAIAATRPTRARCPLESLQLRPAFEAEVASQPLGVGAFPRRVEAGGVAPVLRDRHLAGEGVLLGQIADAGEDPLGIGDRVEPEDADGALVGLEEAEQVLDEGGLPAPFSPMRPSTSPLGRASETSRSAVFAP